MRENSYMHFFNSNALLLGILILALTATGYAENGDSVPPEIYLINNVYSEPPGLQCVATKWLNDALIISTACVEQLRKRLTNGPVTLTGIAFDGITIGQKTINRDARLLDYGYAAIIEQGKPAHSAGDYQPEIKFSPSAFMSIWQPQALSGNHWSMYRYESHTAPLHNRSMLLTIQQDPLYSGLLAFQDGAPVCMVSDDAKDCQLLKPATQSRSKRASITHCNPTSRNATLSCSEHNKLCRDYCDEPCKMTFDNSSRYPVAIECESYGECSFDHNPKHMTGECSQGACSFNRDCYNGCYYDSREITNLDGTYPDPGYKVFRCNPFDDHLTRVAIIASSLSGAILLCFGAAGLKYYIDNRRSRAISRNINDHRL